MCTQALGLIVVSTTATPTRRNAREDGAAVLAGVALPRRSPLYSRCIVGKVRLSPT